MRGSSTTSESLSRVRLGANRRPAECEVDVAVIGGGVVGCSIAASVSRTNCSVALLEASHDVATGTSSANSGVTSTGWAMSADSLEARLVRSSNSRWEDLSRRLRVPFRRCGRLILAVEEDEAARIDPLLERAASNEVDVRRLDPAAIGEIAPYANADAVAAIHIPGDGVVDSMRLTIAFAELAVSNGAKVLREAPVIGAEAEGPTTTLLTPTHRVTARFVVNAAGLGADRVSRILGCEVLGVTPRRGEWLLLDREFGRDVPMILAQLPTERTHGMMVLPTAHGSVLLGPTAEDIEDPDDRSTSAEVLEEVLAACRRLMPGIDDRYVTKSFAGIRAHATPTYLVERSELAPNVVQAIGIRSSGISSSPAMGEHVLGLLMDAGLDADRSVDAVDELNQPLPYRLGDDGGWEDRGPADRTVICACEKVTAQELHDAFTSPVPATSISGAARRTHATWGRCQGSACLSGVCLIASQYMDCRAWEIPLGDAGSTIGVGVADRV